MNKFIMDEEGHLTRNPDYKEVETYIIYCRTCEKEIGESETDDNGFVVCLDCWHKV